MAPATPPPIPVAPTQAATSTFSLTRAGAVVFAAAITCSHGVAPPADSRRAAVWITLPRANTPADGDRRDQLRHPHYQKPQLLATGSNQVWSWDITKLLGPVKWTYFYLYVILDIFSRYAVGWIVAERESA